MRLLVVSACLLLFFAAIPCNAQRRPKPVVAHRVGNATFAQQGAARALVANPSGVLPLTRSCRSVSPGSGVPCPSADTSRTTDRIIIGGGLLLIGTGGVTLAVIGGVGAYHLFTAGEDPLLALGATVGLLSIIIGTIAVRTLIQGVRILWGGDLRIPGESEGDPPPLPPLPSQESSPPSLLEVSISL